ncbi:MAG: SMP-30/gluconolactonase/LRE family protein [Acidobacteriales bacterium]|nr:SMP-30/gluconolactonase/LRE family protein [Terriglobales bacterium]
MPVALQIAPGEVEQLYGHDLRMESIHDAALVAGNARSSHSEITLTNVICSDVPRFFRGKKPIKAPTQHYLMDRFSLGLEIGADGREQGIALRHQEHALAKPAPTVPTDVPALPPMEKWTNVHTLGVTGDGTTDDTNALLAAIEQYPVLFFPSGSYRVSHSLVFSGDGDPVGILVAPKEGRNIVTAIAITTGRSNPRAVGTLWMAGPNSLMDDVSFPGQFGRMDFRGPGGVGQGRLAIPGTAKGTPAVNAPNMETSPVVADLLITNGGGGIFRNTWPHGTNAKIGLRVENTETPGKIYQLSVEHHVRVESEFHKVRNWEIYALQTEEENPAGADAYALDIEDSQDLQFANTYMYRVSRNVLPKTNAIITRRSDRIIFENVKVFSQTRLAFDNAVFDESSSASVRPHFFTSFTVNQETKPPALMSPPAAVFAKRAKLKQLASGFSNASGLTVGDAGTVFFTDAVKGKVYRWNDSTRNAEMLAEIPGQPQVLGFVPPSSILAITNQRAVYYLDSVGPGSAQLVNETPELLPQTTLLLPVGLHNQLSVMQDMMEHRGYIYRPRSNTAIISVVPNEHRGYFYAPGSRTAVMAGGTWRPTLQSSQLAAFTPGVSHYLTSEDDGRTYLAKLDKEGKLSTTIFVERGGTSVVTDSAGNVYIAAGQVWIYNRAGKQLGVLEVPERPSSLAFGGRDRRTLYIGARGSLYSIRTVAHGR